MISRLLTAFGFLGLAMAACATPAAAQTMPPDDLQRLIQVIAAQREAAANLQAYAEMRAAKLADDLAKANAKIAALEKPAAAPTVPEAP